MRASVLLAYERDASIVAALTFPCASVAMIEPVALVTVSPVVVACTRLTLNAASAPCEDGEDCED